MANSALSGNTSGLATATSPGLVGTGAQTFAGKKTLDGGALIKGDTSGSAIAAGYVGEVITWASAPSTSGSVTSTSYVDWTNAFITLSKGKWELKASVSVEAVTSATSGQVASGVVAIRTGSSVVNNQEAQVYIKATSAVAADVQSNLYFNTVVDVAADNTVYKLSYKYSGGAGGSANFFNAALQYSNFYAVRIA
jgi:hypothetical protein